MRGTLVLAALAFLAVAPSGLAGSEVVPLSFESPAQLTASGTATGLEWALLFFRDSTAQATFAVEALDYTNTTIIEARIHALLGLVETNPRDGPPARTEAIQAPLEESLSFERQGWATLFIQADDITLTHSTAVGQLVAAPMRSAVDAALPNQYQWVHANPRPGVPMDSAAVGLEAPETGLGFSLDAEGLRSVAWSNALHSCPASQSSCPDGAGYWNQTVQSPAGDRVNLQRISFSTLTTGTGTLHAEGGLVALAAGGASVDLALNGSMRLPLAQNEQPCGSCFDPEGQTLSVSGALQLEDLQASGDRLEADVGGNVTSARLDEASLDPAQVWGAVGLTTAGAAGVVGAVLLVRFLGSLFSRTTDPDDLLRNERRRQLYEAIREHPASSYRFLMDLTQTPDGTTRHHLAKLVQAGLVVARRLGGHVRYFENHGRYDKDWHPLIILKNPGLRSLYDLIQREPGQEQRALIAQARKAWGLPRTTVQDRLLKLVEAGLVAVERQDRLLLYSARSNKD